jgi:hypothetical protein
MIVGVKTRSHRIVSLALRALPLGAVLALVEQGPSVMAFVGPKGFD